MPAISNIHENEKKILSFKVELKRKMKILVEYQVKDNKSYQ